MNNDNELHLEKLAQAINLIALILFIFFFILGSTVSFYFHFLTVPLLSINLLNFYYIYIQKRHTLLSNFGILAQVRYFIENVGPELRQYLFSSDTEERPFSRIERAEIYQKAKNLDSSSCFGSQLDFDEKKIQLLHSFFPANKKDIQEFHLTLGEERGLKNQFTLNSPIIISGMSYGALSSAAIRALARGARKTNTLINTGEGGFPKYHLMEKANLIFQMGTAKFGVRNEQGQLDLTKLEKLSQEEHIKSIEIKFSQGAKPGKGGILPKEKITTEISQLRGVPKGKDVNSPPQHEECKDAKSTVHFIQKVQEVSQLPVGIKFCLGKEQELFELLFEMKKQNVFPDYINIDGAEGGTGAAPKSFMDDFGFSLFQSLKKFNKIKEEHEIQNKFKVLVAGKLMTASRQLIALSLGADAVAVGRGFMLSIGCIQALQCNKNTCPVGITTHNPKLTYGLNIEEKSDRVKNYIENLTKEHYELMSAIGVTEYKKLNTENLILPETYN